MNVAPSQDVKMSAKTVFSPGVDVKTIPKIIKHKIKASNEKIRIFTCGANLLAKGIMIKVNARSNMV